MAGCSCGADAVPGDAFCQQCGARLPIPPTVDPALAPPSGPAYQPGPPGAEATGSTPVPPTIAVSPSPGAWGALGARLDRFAAEGQEGGLVRGSLADAVAVLRQEPRWTAAAVGVVMGVALAGLVVLGLLVLAVTAGSVSVLSGPLSSGDDLGTGQAVAGLGLLGLWLVLPAVGGFVSAVTVGVAGAARYLPLLGRLPSYRHRGLDAAGSRWGRAVGPTVLSSVAVWGAYLLCALPGLYVLGRLAFTPHEAVAGGHPSGQGPLGRSWERTRASVWPVLGLILLSGLIASVPLLLAWLLLALVSLLTEGSASGGAVLLTVPLALIGGVAFLLAVAAPPLPLAAAWLRLTAREGNGSPDQQNVASTPASGSAALTPMGFAVAREADTMEARNPADGSPEEAAASSGDAVPGVEPRGEAPAVEQASPASLEDAAALTRPVEAGVCSGCGRPLEPDHRFCGDCGTPVPQSPGTAPTAGLVGSAALGALAAASSDVSDTVPADLEGVSRVEPAEQRTQDVEEPTGQGLTPVEEAAVAVQPSPMVEPLLVCPGCGRDVTAETRFCGDCGTPIEPGPVGIPSPAGGPQLCQGCGSPLEPDALFCGDCGTPTVAGAVPSGPVAAGASRRRRWPVVAAIAGVLVVAAVAAGLVWGLPLLQREDDSPQVAVVGDTEDETSTDTDLESGVTPTPRATETTPPPATAAPVDATTQLLELAEEGAKELSTIRSGVWVPQVSSKCTPLTSLDYEDRSGRAGWPDGETEDFPGGITDEDILAFHEGLASRLGLTTGELILVTPQDLGMTGPPPAVCGSAPIWVSLVAVEQSATEDGALDYCAASGLPTGECAARLIGSDTEIVLPTGDAPDPSDPDTYPVLVDTFLTVRTSPSADASEVGRVPAGGYVTIVCTTQGDPVTDPFGDVITRWDRISRPFEGYVADAFVDTGGRPPEAPPC